MTSLPPHAARLRLRSSWPGRLVGSMFSSWPNALITLTLAFVAWKAVPPLVQWLFLGAVWYADAGDACRGANGACWAFVAEKARFILFGFFPYEQQWRPLASLGLFLALMVVSAQRAAWRPSLLVAWLVTLLGIAALLRGGWAGLEPVPTTRWGGLPLTLLLATVGCAAAFPIGIVLALGRTSDMPLVRWVCAGYIELVRGVPLITILFMASLMLPLFMPKGLEIDTLVRAQVGIILFVSAYLAEVVRGGLIAIPRGQYEASHALGLAYWQMQWTVVLPQALRISVPALTNTFIGVIKDTSLVAIIGLIDLLGAARQALTDPDWLGFYRESYLFVALIYFVICFSVSRYARHLEARIRSSEHA